MALDRPIHAPETAGGAAAPAVAPPVALVNEPPTTTACTASWSGGKSTLTTHHPRWPGRQGGLTPSREREETESSDSARPDGTLPGSKVRPDPSDVGLSRGMTRSSRAGCRSLLRSSTSPTSLTGRTCH